MNLAELQARLRGVAFGGRCQGGEECKEPATRDLDLDSGRRVHVCVEHHDDYKEYWERRTEALAFGTVPCEGMFGPCGKLPAAVISCRTAYHNELANRDPIMCEECAKWYKAHWDEMWAEYYSGRL